MKDQLEQLYISACIGQWDAETFANKAMELMAITYHDLVDRSDKEYQLPSFDESESCCANNLHNQIGDPYREGSVFCQKCKGSKLKGMQCTDVYLSIKVQLQ